MKKISLFFLATFSIAFAGELSPYVDSQISSGQPWVNTDVLYEFPCTSDNTGGSGCWTSAACPISTTLYNYHNFTSNGGPVTLCHSDNAGNEVFQETYVNWIDKNRPEILASSLVCEKKVDIFWHSYDGTWTNNHIKCSFNIKDTGGSKIKSIVSNGFEAFETRLAINSIDLNNTPVTFGFYGTEELDKNFTSASFIITDYATNTNTTANQEILTIPPIKIDRTASNIYPVSCSANPALNTNGWTTGNVSCSYSITDPNPFYHSKLESWNSTLSSPNGIGPNQSSFWPQVNKSGENESSITETMPMPFSADQNREYSLSIDAKDHANNQTVDLQTFEIKIDGTRPYSKTDGIQLTSQARTVKLSQSSSHFEADEEFELKLNIEDDMSGIDWNTSTINIIGPISLSTVGIGNITSAGISFDPITKIIFFDNSTDIFEKIGTYSINLEIKDPAGNTLTHDEIGNPVNITNLQVKIKSSETIITNNNGTDCTGIVLANNDDVCIFPIEIKDRFGNGVDTTTFEAVFDIQDMNGSYNLIDNTQEAFINGLRFNYGGIGSSITTNNKITFKSKADKTQDISIKAIAPSIEIITGLSGSYLTKPIERSADIIFFIPKINPDGTVCAACTKIEYRITSSLDFKPWVKASLSDNQNGQFSYGDAIHLYINSTTENAGKNLPNNLKTEISGYTPSGLYFSNEALPYTMYFDEDPNNDPIYYSKELNFSTHLNSLGGLVEELNIAFSSMVEHDVLDNWGTVRTIEYPGGNLGNKVGNDNLFSGLDCTIIPIPIGCNEGDVSSIVVGADIEGQILTEGTNFTYQEDGSSGKSGITRMGNISATDIREEITQNTYELIRGLSAETNTTLNNLDLGINEVKYFDSDVTLSGIISGKGTIVIKDGNLIINNNLVYNNDVTDSLGVILINSSAKSHPTTGNIYVKPTVQNIVGTYFADGGFMSVDNLGNPDNIDREDEDSAILKKQLLLNGTLLTRNTFGGAMFNISGFLDPWGTPPGIDSTAKRKIAQKYDLHFVRRYKQSGDIDPTIKGSAPDYNPYCVADGVSCDTNKHAFILRPDGKVKNIPPPGF
ncbi:hypothetical protein KAI58_04005 [Candidatus Gracilibacteria bacterium]|nr:hypothetical protein [Candidatus Gracilibacteria bacterium]